MRFYDGKYNRIRAAVQKYSNSDKWMSDKLDDRARQVLVLHYAVIESEKPRTLEEIGIALNLTRQRIKQIEDTALRRLDIK